MRIGKKNRQIIQEVGSLSNMNVIFENLRNHFEQQPSVNYGDASSIMEALFWMFTENNNLDNEEVKQQFTKLREYLNLPMKEYDEVFYIVSTLCLAYGQSAFNHGLRLGFTFAQELSKE